jgi:hypothetical protein
MCKNTQMNKKKCGTSDIGLIECNNHIKRVSYLIYLEEKKTQGGKKARLCAGNMTLSKRHLNSMKRVHLATCQMCGKKTWEICQNNAYPGIVFSFSAQKNAYFIVTPQWTNCILF